MGSVSAPAGPLSSSISEPLPAGPPSAGSHSVLGGCRAAPDDDRGAPMDGRRRRDRDARTADRGGGHRADRRRRPPAATAGRRPVTERRLDLEGASTVVLEGGDGPPRVLLHGQSGWAGVWLPVMAADAAGPGPPHPPAERGHRHGDAAAGVGRREVARIDVPTSLIWGRQDRVPLAAAREA